MARRRKEVLKKDTSKVVRFSGENYEAFTKLKAGYAAKHSKKKVTYDVFLEELLRVAGLLIEGKEVYRVGDKAFDDIAVARGEAIMTAVSQGIAPTPPQVLIDLGPDDLGYPS